MDLMNEDNLDGDRKPADESSDTGNYDGNNFFAPSNEEFVLAIL